LQKAKTDTQLQLILADGTLQTLATEAIESIKPGKSLMPSGLVDSLTREELVDLLRFLIDLGRAPAYTVDTMQRVRNWSVLTWTAPANQLLNRTSLDSAASDAAQLIWAPLTSTVAGRLPVGEAPVYQPHRETPSLVFASFDIDCQQSGDVRFEFTSPGSAFSIWLDGRPRPVPLAAEAVPLTQGRHRVVLGLKVQDVGASFGCVVHTEQSGSAVVELKPRP